jgi:hypothetical protein
MINEDKIQKNVPTIEFDFKFDVIEFNEVENDTYALEIYEIKDDQIVDSPINLQLNDVRVVNFIGKEDRCSVVVSNSIIHQYIGNKKQHGKHYFYFYIKEDADWVRVDQHIWLDEKEINRIAEEHGQFTVKPDENINFLGLTGMM